MEDFEVEVEYQQATIGKYELDFENNNFIFRSKPPIALRPISAVYPRRSLK
jgi:hypothetical protein